MPLSLPKSVWVVEKDDVHKGDVISMSVSVVRVQMFGYERLISPDLCFMNEDDAKQALKAELANTLDKVTQENAQDAKMLVWHRAEADRLRESMFKQCKLMGELSSKLAALG